MPIQTICEIKNLSRRSAYRRLEQASESFMAILSTYGYTLEKIEINYLNDPFLSSICKLVERNNFVIEEKANVITNDSIFNKYINELMAAAI